MAWTDTGAYEYTIQPVHIGDTGAPVSVQAIYFPLIVYTYILIILVYKFLNQSFQ
jgi:hypothetical protein